MSSFLTSEWINLLETDKSTLARALQHYECPQYLFAEEYDREKLKTEILNSHRLKDAFEKLHRETGCAIDAAEKEAAQIIDEISHSFTLKMVRVFSVLLTKIFSIFKQVLVNKDGIEKFKEISKVSPVVLVPTHNSYFDFLLASAICFWLNAPIPAIVAGQDFLHIAVVNHMLRWAGAFFMRRSFASDALYRSIFTEYVQRLLSSGNRPIEFFVEGTRSRCGKALQPKLGLLAMMLESYFHGFVQDVAFVPVSISYEKATEEFLYLYELLGIPKPKESLVGLLKSRSILNTDYGTVSVYFGEPLSLREYCSSMVDSTAYIHIPRCERHLRTFGRGPQEMEIAKYFGRKLVHTQQNNAVVFPRSVIAGLFLSSPDTSYGLEELASKVDSIGKLLGALGCNLVGFENGTISRESLLRSVNYCDYVLNLDSDGKVMYTPPVVEESLKKTKLMETTNDIRFISRSLGYVYLSSQRNKVIHSSLLPSMLLHAIRSTSLLQESKVQFESIYKLFQIEFIFEPSSNVDALFDSTYKALTDLSLIGVDNDQHLILSEENKTSVFFLLNLLQPFFDAYMVVCHLLMTSSYEYPTSFKSLSAALQHEAAIVIINCGMSNYESLSLHTLSNIITSFCKNGQLKTTKNDKFETLINGIDMCVLENSRKSLLQFVSPELRMYVSKSKL